MSIGENMNKGVTFNNFYKILNQINEITKKSSVSVVQMAEIMGFNDRNGDPSETIVYATLNGQHTMKPGEMRHFIDLFESYPDLQECTDILFEYLFGSYGKFVRQKENFFDLDGKVNDDIMRISVAMGKLSQNYLEAIKDRELNDNERGTLTNNLLEARRSIDAALEELKNGATE